jgi:hypothetical protein
MKPPFAQPGDFDSQEERQPDPLAGRKAPPDFLADEAAFAQTLQTAFPLEREEIPPLFFQTLYGTRHDALAPGNLEQSIAARVFQRLELPLPPAPVPPARRQPAAPASPARRVPPLGRPHRALRLPQAAGLSALFTVLLCLVFGAVALEQGALGLFAQMRGPAAPGASASNAIVRIPRQLPWREAAQVLPFTIYWLGQDAPDYAFQSLRLRLAQAGAAGPLVESQYGIMGSTATIGLVTVRQFQPAVGNTILATAERSAVQSVQVNGLAAIAVDGQWGRQDEQTVWDYGSQAQLLYVAHGLLFWITVQQDAAPTLSLLQQIAASLERLYVDVPLHHDLPDVSLPPPLLLAPALPPPALVGGAARVRVSIAEQGAPILLSIEQPSS